MEPGEQSKPDSSAGASVDELLARLPDFPIDGSTVRVESVVVSRQETMRPEDMGCHFLVVIDGGSVGRWFEIGTRPLLIGRSEPADIVLGDPLISRRHCVVQIDDGSLAVVDQQSTNGTYVDEQRCGEPTALQLGQIMRMGRTRLRHVFARRGAGEEANRLLDNAHALQTSATELRVEIDETKRAEEVRKITRSDYFADLIREADALRSVGASD